MWFVLKRLGLAVLDRLYAVADGLAGVLDNTVLHETGPVARLEIAVRGARRLPTRTHATLHTHLKSRYAKRHSHPASAEMAERLTLGQHVALLITGGIGTLTCAAIFAALAFTSLPAVLASHNPMYFIQWLSGTFLQLVLLAVLQLGGNLASRHAELLAEQTHALAQQTATDVRTLREQLSAKGTLRAAKKSAKGAI